MPEKNTLITNTVERALVRPRISDKLYHELTGQDPQKRELTERDEPSREWGIFVMKYHILKESYPDKIEDQSYTLERITQATANLRATYHIGEFDEKTPEDMPFDDYADLTFQLISLAKLFEGTSIDQSES